jgi:hypothetical protein
MGGNICFCDACTDTDAMLTTSVRSVYGDCDEIRPNDAVSLHDEVLALCSRLVYGYVLKERQWSEYKCFPVVLQPLIMLGIFDIDCVSEPIFNTEIMDTLVIDENKKEVIKAICYEFTKVENSAESYAADEVRGKGTGRIFLLHGMPGVGKTLTAGM